MTAYRRSPRHATHDEGEPSHHQLGWQTMAAAPKCLFDAVEKRISQDAILWWYKLNPNNTLSFRHANKEGIHYSGAMEVLPFHADGKAYALKFFLDLSVKWAIVPDDTVFHHAFHLVPDEVGITGIPYRWMYYRRLPPEYDMAHNASQHQQDGASLQRKNRVSCTFSVSPQQSTRRSSNTAATTKPVPLSSLCISHCVGRMVV